MESATLQSEPSVESFLNAVETETFGLFEQLSFEFLSEFDVFAPPPPGRTRVHEPAQLMRGVLHCYYKDIYGIRPAARELHNPPVWLGYGFDRPPSRDAVDRFLTDLEPGVTTIPIRHLVVAAVLGRAPGLLVASFIGAELTDGRLVVAGVVAAVLVVAWAVGYRYHHRLHDRLDRTHGPSLLSHATVMVMAMTTVRRR